jgi:hypothetical protein
VVLSRLFLSFGHDGRQMLGSNTRRLLDPKHGKKWKVSITRCAIINALHSPLGESSCGLFIGAVRGLVIMFKRPPNHPVHTECTVMRALQSFYIAIYFTSDLLDGDTCPLLDRHSPYVTSWAFDTGSPPDEDGGGPIATLRRHGCPRPPPRS